MARTYTPDCWVILEISSKKDKSASPIYKVMGGWSGSYTYGSSWKVNSGITKVEYDPVTSIALLRGASGSVYSVHENNCRVNSMMAAVISASVEQQNDPEISKDLDFVMREMSNEESIAFIKTNKEYNL